MSEIKVEHPCRFCGGLFPREFNEAFIDETCRYHFIVGPAGILSEEQHFHKNGRRLGRKHQKKKIAVEQVESKSESED
jgi:hypothetical protein